MDESEIPSLIEQNDALRSLTCCPTDTISFWTDTVPSLQEKLEFGPSIKCVVSRLLGDLDGPDLSLSGESRRRDADWTIIAEQ